MFKKNKARLLIYIILLSKVNLMEEVTLDKKDII